MIDSLPKDALYYAPHVDFYNTNGENTKRVLKKIDGFGKNAEYVLIGNGYGAQFAQHLLKKRKFDNNTEIHLINPTILYTEDEIIDNPYSPHISSNKMNPMVGVHQILYYFAYNLTGSKYWKTVTGFPSYHMNPGLENMENIRVYYSEVSLIKERCPKQSIILETNERNILESKKFVETFCKKNT